MNEVRHRTGGGRSARMAARTGEGARPHAPAFIRREIPPYELLSEEGLALIEANADRILADVGIEIRDDPDSLQLFKDAGAAIDGITVHFDPGHVKALCATAPKQFTQLARNPAKSVEIGGNNVVLAPTYGSPFVRDLAGGRRYGTLADFQNFVKLTYDTPWLHHSGAKRHSFDSEWTLKALQHNHAQPARAVDDVVLDATTGHGTDHMAIVAHRQHGAFRARRTAPGVDDGHQQHAPPGMEPLGTALQDFEIDTVHCCSYWPALHARAKASC